MSTPRVVVAQLGARMHYAVPRILWHHGMLERLFTDIVANTSGLDGVLGLIPRRWRPTGLERLLQRRIESIASDRVTSSLALAAYYAWKRGWAKCDAERMRADLAAGSWLGRCVARRGLERARAVYGFNSASKELFVYARSQGARCVLEQTIAPRVVERRILQREQDRWPEWETSEVNPYLDAFCEREAAEWELADLILCGSEFVRDGIGAAGGPTSKCRIVPYGVDGPSDSPGRISGDRFRVLFAGTVGLRKGAQYLYASAAALATEAIRFRAVGPVRILPRGLAMLRQVVDVAGAVPRFDMAREFASADVLVLPTLVEGSATVCYEAMAAGVPIITTPNAGSVVRDGIEGFIVPACDSEALASRIAELAADPARARRMGERAKMRAAEFTVVSYGHRLIEALTDVVNGATERSDSGGVLS